MRKFSLEKNFASCAKIFCNEQLVYPRMRTCVNTILNSMLHRIPFECHIANSSQVKLAVTSNTVHS